MAGADYDLAPWPTPCRDSISLYGCSRTTPGYSGCEQGSCASLRHDGNRMKNHGWVQCNTGIADLIIWLNICGFNLFHMLKIHGVPDPTLEAGTALGAPWFVPGSWALFRVRAEGGRWQYVAVVIFLGLMLSPQSMRSQFLFFFKMKGLGERRLSSWWRTWTGVCCCLCWWRYLCGPWGRDWGWPSYQPQTFTLSSRTQSGSSEMFHRKCYSQLLLQIV